LLGDVARSLFVARSWQKIFDFRAARVAALFGGDGACDPPRAQVS
jgi:hypothetical protein